MRTSAALRVALVFFVVAPTFSFAQFVQQAKLAGTGAVWPDERGESVSIASDGNTAVIGGGNNGSGAKAWVWTRSGQAWTQGPNLSAGTQGSSRVAISGDGNTILVGRYQNEGAFIWTRSGAAWTAGPRLFADNAIGNAQQGSSVAISADGNTAVVGGVSDNSDGASGHGAAWIWTRAGGVWTQGPKLVGAGAVGRARQGSSVAIAADGNTVIVGGSGDSNNVGAAWVWGRSGGAWTQQAKLAGSPSGFAHQGRAVALSVDGGTAMVGGTAESNYTGAAWVWVRNGGVWTQQSGKLVGSGAAGNAMQGVVALSGDGNVAVVGGNADDDGTGAVWVWARTDGVWSQRGPKLVGSGIAGTTRPQQGIAVAISSDGTTVIVGGIHDNDGAGAAWIFTGSPLPVIAAPVPSWPIGPGAPPSPTLRWLASRGATSYRLLVATSPASLPSDADAASCAACAIDTIVPTNYLTATAPLSPGTQYFWQVQGRTATQNGPWSSQASFTTAPSGGLLITGVAPSPVVGTGWARTLRIFGGGFQSGMTATLRNVSAGGAPAVLATSSVTATEASVSATFPSAAADWTVTLTNPGGATSAAYPFRVIPRDELATELRVDKLTVDTIASPRNAGVAFPITVRAVDAAGNAVPIAGEVQLVTSAGLVRPSLVRLTNGVGTAQVQLDAVSCSTSLTVTGAGAQGTSNAFALQGAGTGTIAGRVIHPSGAPVESAAVVIAGCGTSTTVFTGPAGWFTTPQLAAGPYSVSAAKGESVSTNATVTVVAGAPATAGEIIINGSPCNPGGLTPILFVPGIMGSTFGPKGLGAALPSFPWLPATPPTQQTVWPYEMDGGWARGPAPYLDGLYFSKLAGITDWSVLRDAIGRRNQAYVGTAISPNPCLVLSVPYDWRMRPDEAARAYLIPRIEFAKQSAGVEKVHLVAHSMGGLVARAYIQSLVAGAPFRNDVDRFAMVGTPNEGSEVAYLLVEGGNPRRADRIGGGFIAAYTNVAEDLFRKWSGKWGPSLLSLYPPQCRSVPAGAQACLDLLERPEADAWTPYRKQLKAFFRLHVPSMQALMPHGRAFLRDDTSQAPRGLGCGPAGDPRYENKFLKTLNDPANGVKVGQRVRAKIFAGILKRTIESFTVKTPQCNDEALSPDGDYLGHTSDEDGDGTVRYGSAWGRSAFTLPMLADEGTHTRLTSVHASAVADFLLGLSPSAASADPSTTPAAARAQPAATTAAPDVELRVIGRARPHVANASGQGCGLQPESGDVEQTIPGCSAIVTQPSETFLSLVGIANGTYTVTLSSPFAEESALSARLDDGTNVTEGQAIVFCDVGSTTLTVTVAAGTATPIRIDGAVAPPAELTASATGTPRTTTLRWNAPDDPDVTGYDVYARRIDEPKLALVAQVAGTSYASADPWVDAAGVPIRNYAVAARAASGRTSVLTAYVANDDRDGDGLSDLDEARFGSDSDNPDTDGDSLRDGEEVASGTDPLSPDSDGDSFSDEAELARGSDPASPSSTPAVPPAPANLIAHATSLSQVHLSWDAVATAASYQIFRRENGGPYALRGSSPVAAFTDSGLAAATTYLYTVTAVDSAGATGPPSAPDLATTVAFTDDPVIPFVTNVRASHVTELAAAIDIVRSAAGLPPAALDAAVVRGLPFRAAHLLALRSSLGAARAALGLAPLADVTIAAGTVVKAVHLSALRAGVK